MSPGKVLVRLTSLVDTRPDHEDSCPKSGHVSVYVLTSGPQDTVTRTGVIEVEPFIKFVHIGL